MDINELENYRLSDAVKFNDRLNPRIWGSDEKMRPEVREKLLAIADDFREFLGITDLNVKDITVSGSNAAFTYTLHSDVDLHLVVDLPKADISDVYRELFDAKKYQYNDQHDYKIGPYDVELYVQNANQPHVSQGIYSIKDNDWVRVPTKRRSTVDDISVRSKYEDMGHRIEKAIASGDLAVMDRMAQRVADMRKSGLATTGEFGPENLAFKALRSTGVLDNLRQARQAAKSKKFSLAERDRARPRKVYGYKSYWFPGYDYYDHGSDGGGLEESKQVEFRTGRTVALEKIVEKFVAFCARRLGLHTVPTITLVSDPGFGADQKTMGHYMDDKRAIEVETGGRHILDILRTVAHELVHYRQHEADDLPHNAGDTGSRWENEAHAVAGVLMRYFDRAHPEYFKARVVDQADEDYDPNGTPPGPEFKPTMPAGTVRVDVSDVYDWYKLGQHISNLKGLGHHDFGKGPPSTIFSFGSEPEEHKYIKNLEKTGLTTTDIDPIDKNQPPGMKKQKVDPTYNVNEATGYIPVNSKEARDPRYSMAITQDIRPGEVQRQAKKMGFTTDAEGVPPTLSTSGRRK